MGKTSNNRQFGSARFGFIAHVVASLIVASLTIGLVTGSIHVSIQPLRTVATLICIAVLIYLLLKTANYWGSWRAGTTTVSAASATSTTTTAPVTPAPATSTATAAPATSTTITTPAAPTVKKITRAYLQQQAAVVDDRMVEAEEVYEAAEKLQDEYEAAKSDYEQKLAKAKARRLTPQQP